ncbi:hypothetical protein ABZ502_19655 [Streptomyces abikoensis]|uniref:hypothetical protein n=1 Tax=Streptomyces abikoensis TaxID=97398 RepID=UPI0033F642B0
MTKAPERFTRTPLTEETIDAILAVYVDARAELQHLEHYRPPRMRKQLERHATRPGCLAAVAWSGAVPVGYAYGCPLGEENTWWSRVYPPPRRTSSARTGGVPSGSTKSPS